MDWQAIEQQVKIAIEHNSLYPLTVTKQEIVENGLSFSCFILDGKHAKRKQPNEHTSNPFLPHEEALFIRSIGDNHKLLLNKFPALKNHCLICSNEFVPQTNALTLADFEAWFKVLSLEHSVGFYNGGEHAGASQPHRHMQVFQSKHNLIAQIAVQLSDSVCYRQEALSARSAYQHYLQCIGADEQPHPYNLILNQHQFMYVKRVRASFMDINANGLNFCGYFLVKDESQRIKLSEFGFIPFLKQLIAK